MENIALAGAEAQSESVEVGAGPQPSANGGVLLLARAWAALGGSECLCQAIRWQGRAGPLLLFALVTLPILSAKSVCAIAKVCLKPKEPLMQLLAWRDWLNQRRLARFVASPRHDWLGVLGAMVGALAHHAATDNGAEGIIAVDSTTVEKRYGPHLPGIRPVYDAVSGKLVDGYEVVSACVAGPKGSYAVGLAPHRKAASAGEREACGRRRRKAGEGELPSKLDLALGFVVLAVSRGGRAPTVVADSAFAVMWWLREIAAVGRHWLVATRQDRRLRIGAEIQAIRDWARAAALTRLETSESGTSLWGALLPEAVLLDRHCSRKGLPCRPIYFERRNRRGQVSHRWYLVTSQIGWDLEDVWRHWSWRWRIEELHRDGKQLLHLPAFHVRTWEGIVALIACTSLRASLLAFMRAADPALASLSTEGLVAALREAACLVTPTTTGQVIAAEPPTLHTKILWHEHHDPLPTQWWPIIPKAA